MNKKQLFSLLFIGLTLMVITSCVKKTFDDPPDQLNYDPKLTVTHTIWDLKQKFYTNGPGFITEDITIYGIVNADDRSGNLYKQVIIQDSTSGIVLMLGRSSGLYLDYPIGRKVYVKCKGLYLGAYGNFIQLGGGYDQVGASIYEVPDKMIGNYVVKANYVGDVAPRVVKISEIAFSNSSQNQTHRQWLGTLIRIDSAEFDAAEVGQIYAQDPNIASATERSVKDCPGGNIVLRTSGYCNFRTKVIPALNGSITAVYSTYETSSKKTPQLMIRDDKDVKFINTRCGGVIVTPPVDITIDSLRKLYIGTDTNQTIVLPNLKIHGVVTCSIQDSNISKFSMMLQDESNKGIVVYYPSGYTYAMGDSVVIDVSAQELIYYRGTLEVKANTTKTTKVGSGKVVSIPVVTLGQLNTDLNNPVFRDRLYESIVVRVDNCTIGGTPTTYSGEKTVTDGTGNIALFTRFSASFANDPCKEGNASITGHATKFFSKNEIVMRKIGDVN
jgi:hypothetical protein